MRALGHRPLALPGAATPALPRAWPGRCRGVPRWAAPTERSAPGRAAGLLTGWLCDVSVGALIASMLGIHCSHSLSRVASKFAREALPAVISLTPDGHKPVTGSRF